MAMAPPPPSAFLRRLLHQSPLARSSCLRFPSTKKKKKTRLTNTIAFFLLLALWPFFHPSHPRLEASSWQTQQRATGFETDAAAVSQMGVTHVMVMKKMRSDPFPSLPVRPRQVHVPPSGPTEGGNRARRLLKLPELQAK